MIFLKFLVKRAHALSIIADVCTHGQRTSTVDPIHSVYILWFSFESSLP